MSAEHLHLLLNHAPLFAVVFSLPLLLYGIFRGKDTVSRIALVGFVTAAILTVPVFVSGNNAEEAVEHISGDSERYIEEHEEAAEATLWSVELLGLLSVVALFVWRKKSLQRGVLLAVCLLAIGVSIAIAYTNNLGGQIRHTELRSTVEGVKMDNSRN